MDANNSFRARRGFNWTSLGVLAACAALGTTAAAAPAPADWPSVGRDQGGQRHSPLTQISPANVGQLKETWVYHMQTDAAKAATAGRRSGSAGLRVSESIPLVIGGNMYLGTPYGRVVALEAATGKEKWVFEIPDGDTPSVRGVEYWKGEGKHPASIVFGTRMGRMYSINAATGKPNPSFGMTSGTRASLSKPAARPIGLGKERPSAFTSSRGSSARARGNTGAKARVSPNVAS